MTLQALDGKPRATATILVFTELGRWKACFCDREADASFFRSAESYAGLMASVESALAEASADWRARTRPARR